MCRSFAHPLATDGPAAANGAGSGQWLQAVLHRSPEDDGNSDEVAAAAATAAATGVATAAAAAVVPAPLRDGPNLSRCMSQTSSMLDSQQAQRAASFIGMTKSAAAA